jgi:c-di-GMP-binding flagellar brake protein YcgR
MYRVGIQFENLTSTLQSALDRYLFRLMRREAWAKRHVRGSLYQATRPRFHERRSTHRVMVPEDLKLLAHISVRKATLDQPLPLSDQALAMADSRLSRAPLRVIDISASGCSLWFPPEKDPPLPAQRASPEVELRPKQTVTVELSCNDLPSPIDGWVIYIVRKKSPTAE